MRYRNLGSCFVVYVSEREVDWFNSRWACSTLSGRQSFSFEKGDLVDRTGHGDGPEAVALSEDAQKYGSSKR